VCACWDWLRRACESPESVVDLSSNREERRRLDHHSARRREAERAPADDLVRRCRYFLSSVGLGAEFFATRNGSATGDGSDAGQGSLPPDRKYSPQYRASFWPFLDLTTSSLTPSSRRTVYLPFEVEK
jgi:hypothetical protein